MYVRASRDQPPDLDILELRHLTTERLECLFRLRYHGNAYVVLTTQIQVGRGARRMHAVAWPGL